MDGVRCSGPSLDTDPLFARLAVEGKRLRCPRRSHRDRCRRWKTPLVASSSAFRPSGPAIDVAEIDLVIVPAWRSPLPATGCTACYYDMFLPTVPTMVGVCFTDQLVDEMPVEAHDVRVGMVVTA